MFFCYFPCFFAQTICRGAAQFLLCRNATSRLSTFRLQYHLYFSTQCLAQKFITLSASFIRDKSKSSRFDVGLSRAPVPTHLCLQFVCRKIASLFADFTLYMDIEKAVQSFTLRHRYVLFFSFCFFFFFSAPLSRLAPNEALPISCEQSRTRNLLRQGLCPLTPQALWRRA